MRLRGIGWTVAVAFSVAACTAGGGSQPSASQPSASLPAPASAGPASPAPVPAGCGQTPVRSGGLPGWTAPAGPPSGVPYVESVEGNLVGVLFGAPLQAPAGQTGRANKILWIVREPRGGQPLSLAAQRLDGRAPELAFTAEAGSSPGEIYPSIVDVPVAGCWHVTARWNGNTATVDLLYAAA